LILGCQDDHYGLIKKAESPRADRCEEIKEMKAVYIEDESDIVCIDSSIEEKKKSPRKSKSRLEKFKKMVNHSDSKHLSVMSSVQIYQSQTEKHLKHSQVSDSFSYLPLNHEMRKNYNLDLEDFELNNDELPLKKIDEAVETLKSKLRIDEDQST